MLLEPVPYDILDSKAESRPSLLLVTNIHSTNSAGGWYGHDGGGCRRAGREGGLSEADAGELRCAGEQKLEQNGAGNFVLDAMI